jgi:hypothetical protein
VRSARGRAAEKRACGVVRTRKRCSGSSLADIAQVKEVSNG